MRRVDHILLASIVMFASLVSGCGYVCYTGTYYRQPTVVGDVKLTQSWTHETIFVDVAEGLTIGVFDCGSSRRICVQFLIDQGHRLVVTDPVVSIQTQSGQILGVGTYERFPVVDREAMAHTPIEFVGGVDRPRTDWERTLSKTMGWNKYGMTFEIPKQTDGEIYVALPRMLLDTHAVPVPRFRFRQAIEEHCSVHSFGT